MIQLSAFIVGEEDVGTIVLTDMTAIAGVLQVVVAVGIKADQHREVRKIRCPTDLITLDEDPLAIGPIGVEPSRTGHIDEIVSAIEGLSVTDMSCALCGQVAAVALATRPVIVVRCAIFKLVQRAIPALIQVPHANVIAVPGAVDVPLIRCSGVVVIHVDVSIRDAREIRHLNPRH